MTRPSSYKKATADKLCDRIATGETLHNICEGPNSKGMPSRKTVQRWQEAVPAFRLAYLRARQDQMRTWADDIVTLIDNAACGNKVKVKLDSPELERIEKDGFVTFVFDKASVYKAREQVEVRKWLMARVLAEEFGDKLMHEHHHRFEGKDDAELLSDLRQAAGEAGMSVQDVAALLSAGQDQPSQ